MAKKMKFMIIITLVLFTSFGLAHTLGAKSSNLLGKLMEMKTRKCIMLGRLVGMLGLKIEQLLL